MNDILNNIDPDRNDALFTNLTANSSHSETKYFSIDEFNRKMTNVGNFSLFSYNIRSFNANGTSFQSLIESLDKHLDFIVLVETWASPSTYKLCNLPEYNSFHVYRNEGRSGGVSIFVRDCFNAVKVDHMSMVNSAAEICSVKVKINGINILIIGIYRPHDDTVQNFTCNLESLLQSTNVNEFSLIIVTGDVNINISNDSSPEVQEYMSLMSSLHFVSVINDPTRFQPNNPTQNPSTLDHIFVNKQIKYFAGILDYDLTDHCPIFLNFEIPVPLNANKTRKTIRPFKQNYFDSLRQKIIHTNWNNLININNINTTFENFISHINKLYCESFPIKIKYVTNKRQDKPWISKEIKNLINLKSYYFKLLRKNLITKRTNNNLKNKVNRIVRNAKTQYYTHTFNSSKRNPRKTWEMLNGLMGQVSPKTHIENIKIDGNMIDSKQEIVDKFIDYFVNVGRKLDLSLSQSNSSPYQFVKPNSKSFYLFPVQVEECTKLIKSLKESKSGIEEIPVKIIKNLATELAEPISKIINLSFSNGTFPRILKYAKITPIYKKGAPDELSNYRPISTLHFLAKIYEKILANRLNKFFTKCKVFSKVQFGFQKGKSTEDALVNLTEYIYESLNSNSHNITVLLDLRKAFDTVNNRILLGKLERYGVRGLPLKLLQSYMLDRESSVCFDGLKSEVRSSNVGLPQGGTLSPTLFLIYINDLPQVSQDLHCTLFADDTTQSLSNPDYTILTTSLNNHLEQTYQWMLANRLTVNVEKTEMIYFSNRQNTHAGDQIYLNNIPISFSNNCKFLGTIIDEKLNFKNHIQCVLGKISRNTGVLYRIRDLLPTEVRIKFYLSLVYPYLSYGITVWGGTAQTHLQPLIIQQKRTIRTIAGAHYLEHTSPLFKQFNILKLKDIYNFSLLVRTFKSRVEGRYRRQSMYPTRDENLCQPVYQRLTQTQRSVSYAGPTLWNELPNNLRSQKSIGSFKKELKKHFLSTY